MFAINLLPPSEKQNLAYEFRRRAALAMGAAIALVELIALVFLMPTTFAILFQKSEAADILRTETDNAKTSGLEERTAEFRTLNQAALRLIRSDGTRRGAHPLLERVIKNAPPGIALSEIRLDLGARTLAVSGFAPTRELFLAFSSALGSDPSVSGVSSPVSNVIRSTNIAFSLSATLKP